MSQSTSAHQVGGNGSAAGTQPGTVGGQPKLEQEDKGEGSTPPLPEKYFGYDYDTLLRMHVDENFGLAEETAKFKKWFETADVDHNGLLTPEELSTALTLIIGDNIPASALKPFIDPIDTNHDGMIDWAEFSTAITEMKAGVRTGPLAQRIKPKLGW
ncbi:hypothetical protein Pelo_4973 [Pelomyxa schiedti]|nr:hypothetical protein Pelo_4973 [Pelomyxa schiedti]